MNEMSKKIKEKLFEIGALVVLKNRGLIDEKQFLKLKEDVEKEYYIYMRLDFNIFA